MASGGARARSGPPPDPNALRRDRQSDADGWVTLPAEGRTDPAPAWPLGSQSDAEQALWVKLWAKPQAIEWARLGLDDEVALYVRRFLEAAEREASSSLGTLVRQLAENLGISAPGMLRLRWKIAPADQAAAPQRRSGAAPAKTRLRVVADDASA